MTRRTGFAKTDDALAAGIDSLLQRPLNPFGLAVGPGTSFIRALPGKINLVDASTGDVNIMLPGASRELIGQIVAIKNVSSQQSYYVRVSCNPNDQIDGYTGTRNIEPYDNQFFLCYAPNKWTRFLYSAPRGSDPTWNYLDAVLPYGVAAAPISVYQFDDSSDSLTDRVGANDLTVTGTERYATVYDHKGISFDGSTTAGAAGSNTYRITGAFTLELVCLAHAYSASTDLWVYCSATGETQATNSLYQFQLGTTGALSYFAEKDGTDVAPGFASTDLTVGFQTIQPIGVMQHYVMARDSDGDVTLYVNGRQSGDQGSLASPDGGSTGTLVFGSGIFGTLFSARLTAVEFTAAQALESYRRVRGEA